MVRTRRRSRVDLPQPRGLSRPAALGDDGFRLLSAASITDSAMVDSTRRARSGESAPVCDAPPRSKRSRPQCVGSRSKIRPYVTSIDAAVLWKLFFYND